MKFGNKFDRISKLEPSSIGEPFLYRLLGCFQLYLGTIYASYFFLHILNVLCSPLVRRHFSRWKWLQRLYRAARMKNNLLRIWKNICNIGGFRICKCICFCRQFNFCRYFVYMLSHVISWSPYISAPAGTMPSGSLKQTKVYLFKLQFCLLKYQKQTDQFQRKLMPEYKEIIP